MSDEKEMVTVPVMNNCMGASAGPDRNFYGPGVNVKVPKATADLLGLEYGQSKKQDASEEEGVYNSMTVDALKALVEERELEVEGSGSGGNVVKADLIAALEADDQD